MIQLTLHVQHLLITTTFLARFEEAVASRADPLAWLFMWYVVGAGMGCGVTGSAPTSPCSLSMRQHNSRCLGTCSSRDTYTGGRVNPGGGGGICALLGGGLS